MTFDLPAVVGLHALCALIYGFLTVLIFARLAAGEHERSRTGLWLAAACLATAICAGAVAVLWGTRFMGIAGWLELARIVAW